MSGNLYIQISYLARRSILRTLRQPATVIPAIIFPLMLLAINAGGLDAAASIPGFPADSYLDFVFAFPLIQGALFAALSAGADFARDIESGFLNRLSLTPMRPVALLTGLLSGVLALGLLQGVVFLSVGLLAGLNVQAGIPGMLVLLLLMMLTALGLGSFGTILALRTGSGEAVQGSFPLFFVAIFLSSVLLPRDQIEADWFRVVATINPVSYLVEGLRSLIITGWDLQALALGFGAAGVLIVAGLFGAAASLKTRVART